MPSFQRATEHLLTYHHTDEAVLPLPEALVWRFHETAEERHAVVGVDTVPALASLAGAGIKLHGWQGDDLGKFEDRAGEICGGLAAYYAPLQILPGISPVDDIQSYRRA
ncbi:MAG TPA: L-rhamnose isomerase [Anaerolineales bacterium]|nr:L-rhamnose isomerase [Anaerolineales bacterium]